jgi:hypothetical protein
MNIVITKVGGHKNESGPGPATETKIRDANIDSISSKLNDNLLNVSLLCCQNINVRTPKEKPKRHRKSDPWKQTSRYRSLVANKIGGQLTIMTTRIGAKSFPE